MRPCNNQKSGPGLVARATLALAFLSSEPFLFAQSQGMLVTGSTTGSPSGSVSIPVTVALNSGISIDTLGLTVVVSPVGSASPITTGKLSFAPTAGFPSPSLATADSSNIVLAWLGNLSSSAGHALSGVAQLGTITATIPVGAQIGQSYNIKVTKAEADITVNGSPKTVALSSVSSTIGPISPAGSLAPVIQANGVLNAASFAINATVSPGSIASLFGQNLATTASINTSIPPSTNLAGTELLLNGIPAPLFYVSPTQINFQVPVEISGTSAQAVALFNGTSSLTTTVQLSPTTPGIFTSASSGAGQGTVLNQDYSVNSAQNPAAAGSSIMIYATGLGPVSPLVATGQGGGVSPPSVTPETALVMINSLPAQVLYSGLAPGFPGEYQVNAVVPLGTASGPSIPLQVQIGGQKSNTVTIAVY